MNLGILCSGELGFHVLKQLTLDYSISFVFTDKKSIQIQNFCEELSIPIFIGIPRHRAPDEFLSSKKCDVLLSVNYLFIVEENLIKFPQKFAINIHGSLLPKYRGRTPHVWSIINNEQKTGITAHLIDQGCDTGDIIEQMEIDISSCDTGASLLTKYKNLYIPIISMVLNKIKAGKLNTVPQDHSKATLFGKRIPEDGLINWNWQKERIYNWIRAQAFPYPGAFTFVDESNKLTIDSISFTDDGFDDKIPNGSVISINPLKVKTPNGVIIIEKWRENVLSNLTLKTILR